MNLIILAINLISLSVLAKCKKIKLSSEDSSQESDSDEYKEILRTDKNPEQFDLTGRLRQSFALELFLFNGVSDMVCSPISALMPIAKLALGAVGTTETELHNTIGVMKRSQIKDKFQNIIKTLKKLPGVKLNVASRIFVSDKAHLNKTFTQETKSIFDSSVVKVNFDNDEATADTINKWISNELNKLQKVQLNLKLAGIANSIIINIVTFEGNWDQKFHKAGNKTFHSVKGDITVPMMSCQGFYRHIKSDFLKAQVIEIPYKNRKASFVIVLPFSRTGLTGLLKHLNHAPKLLNDAMEEMSTKQVVLTLPKFKIQFKQNVIPIYKLVGLNEIFRDKSGLTGIIQNEQLTVSQAFQITTIDVNEEGTHAGSATGIEMILVSLDVNKVLFTASHPFLFYVKVGKEQLFAGVYAGHTKVSLFQ